MENENEKKKKKLTLPRNAIVEILLRLPVRSLLRFRKVSPLWSSLISDPQFAKSHFELNAAPSHRLLLRFLKEERVQSFDLDSPLDDRSAVKTLNLPSPSMWCDHNPLYFFGSCRGFMLLGYEDTGDVIVWNPTTRFDQQIQDFEFDDMSGCLHGFGYDKSTEDYFVVLITLIRTNQAEIDAFSLKTESWHGAKPVNGQYMDLGDDSRTGVFLNDSLHWLVTSRDTKDHVVIAFDLVEKNLSEIPLSPSLAAELTRKVYYLRVMGGCLSLCSSGGGGMRDSAEIWVMKKYKVQSSWTKAFVITSCHVPCRHFYPICFIEGGGVVGSDGNGTLLKFSSKGKLLEHRKYDREYKKVSKYFEMYTESLLLFPGEQQFLCAKSLPGEQPPVLGAKPLPGEQPPLLCATLLPGDSKEATKDEEEKAIEEEEEKPIEEVKEKTIEEEKEKAIEEEEEKPIEEVKEKTIEEEKEKAIEEEEEKTIEEEKEKAIEDEEEEATEDEYATEDDEEEATTDEYASEDDEYASEDEYVIEDEEEATEDEEEEETDDEDEDDL